MINHEELHNIAREKKEVPEYIVGEIKKAANEGKYSYIYNCGSNQEREVTDFIFQEFKAFNPRIVQVENTEVINYDMGVYKVYYTDGIKFSW